MGEYAHTRLDVGEETGDRHKKIAGPIMPYNTTGAGWGHG